MNKNYILATAAALVAYAIFGETTPPKKEELPEPKKEELPQVKKTDEIDGSE